MGSVGNVKKLVWEKKTPVRRGQHPRFFLTKKSVTLEKPAKKQYITMKRQNSMQQITSEWNHTSIWEHRIKISTTDALCRHFPTVFCPWLGFQSPCIPMSLGCLSSATLSSVGKI